MLVLFCFLSSMAARGRSRHRRGRKGWRSLMVAHRLTTWHVLHLQPPQQEKEQRFLHQLARGYSLRPVDSFDMPSLYLLLILPLTVCPISHELLTKHRINYPLAFRKLLFSSGRRISHALPAHSSSATPQNLGGHGSFKTAQHSSYIWIN